MISDMMQTVMQISRDAGAIIQNIYDSDDSMYSTKEDGSPLTFADQQSNDCITAALEHHFSYPVLSEEAHVPYEERAGWQTFWLVDPLDGTKEFVNKIDEFAINIALIKHGEPHLGVIYAPMLDEFFFAEKDHGAGVIRHGELVWLSGIEEQNEYVVAESRFHPSAKLDTFCKRNGIQKRMTVGASIKFGRLAEGLIHVYPRFVGSSEWDIASGHIIVKEAGACIIDLQTMREPQYNTKTLRNHYFVVCGKRICFEDLDFEGCL